MIRINLLPFRAARKKENIRRQVSIFLLSLVFLLIILFYYNSSLNSQIDGLNTKIKDAKAELKKYNKINKELSVQFQGRDKVLIDDFWISGCWVEPKGRPKYWKKKISKL